MYDAEVVQNDAFREPTVKVMEGNGKTYPQVRSGVTQAQRAPAPPHSRHLPTSVTIFLGGGCSFFKVQRPTSFSFTLVILPPPTPEKPPPHQLPSLRPTLLAEGAVPLSPHSERRRLEDGASRVRTVEDGGGGGHFDVRG